jgi:hypothetical protein
MQEMMIDPAIQVSPEEEARLMEDMRIEAERMAQERNSRIDGLAAAKYNELENRKRYRTALEQEWIDAEYAYNGEYTSRQLTELTGTRIFKNITRPKTIAFGSHISELLMPADVSRDRVRPTPKPTLTLTADDKTVVGATPEGNPVEMGDISKGISEAAAAAAKAMNLEMEDQLAQCQYNAEVRKAINWGAKYGTIIMRGPTRAAAKRANWKRLEDGVWAMEPNIEAGQIAFEAVNPFHFYPDPVARCIEDSEDVFETFFWPRLRLRAVAKSGFDPEAIKRVLESESKATPPKWRIDLDRIGDMTSSRPQSNDNLYEVWRWQGVLQGQEAVDFFGDDVVDMEAIPAVIWGVGPTVIKWEMSPTELGEMPYSVCQFIPNESNIFGHGLPWAGRHAQESLNAAWRMVIDNGAASAVPSAVVIRDKLHPADGNFELRPKKVWYGQTDPETGQIPDARALVQYIDFPVKLDQLLAIEARCREQFDDEIMFSLVMQGDTGQYTPDTATGTQILYNAGRTALRNLLTDIDDNVLQPNMRRLYNWNMEHSDDETIKGDMQCVPVNLSEMMESAQRSQMINAALPNLMSPQFAHRIDDEKLLELMLKSMRLDEVWLDDTKSQEKQKRMQESQQQQTPQGDPARMKMAEIAAGRLEFDIQTKQQELEIERSYMTAALEELGVTREQFMAKIGVDRMKLDSANQRFNAEARMKALFRSGI